MQFLYEKYDVFLVRSLIQKYSDDAGFDLQSLGLTLCPCDPTEIPSFFKLPVLISSHTTYKIFTGIKVCIPVDYWGLIVPRSSARNCGIIVQSVIDAGYTGWLMPFVTFTQEFELIPGKSILQLVIVKKGKVFAEEGAVSGVQTLRGDKGVGSTNKGDIF